MASGRNRTRATLVGGERSRGAATSLLPPKQCGPPDKHTKNSRCVFFYGDWGREFLVSVESQFSEFVTETKIGLKAQVVREIKGKVL